MGENAALMVPGLFLPTMSRLPAGNFPSGATPMLAVAGAYGPGHGKGGEP